MPSSKKRQYVSDLRTQAADVTKGRVLNAAKTLFVRHGIDKVSIAQIAERAGVAVSTVYALYKSKEGILRGLMSAALFGSRFQEAQAKLAGVTDPVRLVTLTAHVARAIYEAESSELGLMRGASAFSPALRKLEQEFEKLRFEMQEERIRNLNRPLQIRCAEVGLHHFQQRCKPESVVVEVSVQMRPSILAGRKKSAVLPQGFADMIAGLLRK